MIKKRQKGLTNKFFFCYNNNKERYVMKHFWKTAFLVFALLIAVPMIAIGCGKKKEVDPDEGKARYIVTFACTEVASGEKDEQGEDIMMPIGRVSVASKAIEVVEGSKITTNGNEITVGKAKVTATPITNDAAHVYSFDKWEYLADTVQSNMTIKADFKSETAVYTLTFDANGHDINEDLPTDLTVEYGKAFPELPTLSSHGYTFMQNTNSYGFSIDKNASALKDNIGRTTKWTTNYFETYEKTNNYKQVNITEEDFNAGGTYYVKELNDKGKETGAYVVAEEYVAGTKYFIQEHDIHVNFVNHTITLYAQWVENYITVNLYKNVTEWKTTGDKAPNNGNRFVNADPNMKVALYNGTTKVAEATTSGGKARFTGIDILDAEGERIEYSLWAQKSQYDDTLVDTGRKATPYWNNGSLASVNGYVNYMEVTLEADNASHFAENGLSGAGFYLEGEQATLGATAAAGYDFQQWNIGDGMISTDNPYTITVSAPVTYRAISKTFGD